MKFVLEVQDNLALGPLYVPSYPQRRINIIFAIIEWVGNMGTVFYIIPHSSAYQRNSYFLWWYNK